MKPVLSSVAFFCSLSLHAQYYYHDIIGALENNRQMQAYIAHKVKMVTASAYTPEGAKTNEFAEAQQILENGKTLKVTKNLNMVYSSFYQRFDAQNRLISMMDTSSGIQNITTYEYDAAGKIIAAQNKVIDETAGINMVELHQWIYNKDGRVERHVEPRSGRRLCGAEGAPEHDEDHDRNQERPDESHRLANED